jgi:pyruvate dehydrogenase E2 component (dihydrolipoamide acetyltransferase)
MPYEFKFPDVGEGIHEGEIQKWVVKEGDKIKADEPLGEIETDKAVVEMPSPKSGTILKIHVQAGNTIKVGDVMVTILEDGESEKDGKKHLESKAKGAKEQNKQEAANKPSQESNALNTSTKSGDVPYTGSVVGFLEEAKEVKPIKTGQANTQNTKNKSNEVMATPAVRIQAKKKGVDLFTVSGSGPDGRIMMQDIEKVAAASAGPKEEKTSGFKVVKKYDFFGYIDRVPLKGIRRAVANKMTESIFTAVQLTNMHDCDVTELVKLHGRAKPQYEKEGIKLTFMPFIVKAVAVNLKNHPYLNASLEGEEIIQKKYYNIGVAADSEDGLIVPVVKGAKDKSIKDIAKDIIKLVDDVKNKKINMMDLKGGSFTISNLGSVGVGHFTPVINYPESAILGVGRITDKAVVMNGVVVARKVLPLSLTYDHRIVDGAQASRFMIDVMNMLKNCDF